MGFGHTAAELEAERVNRAEYLRTLRPLLPNEAFEPYPRAYVPIVIHVAIVIAGWFLIGTAPSQWWWPLWGLMIGNSLAALSFLAHDVAHRSVTTNRYLLYPTELFLWGLIYVPATLWRRIHGNHHAHTNSDLDPDRRFLEHELTPTGTVAAALLFPNKTLRYNVIYLLYWVIFPFRHAIVALFYPGRDMPSFATAKPRYSVEDKRWMVFEIAFILVLQLIIAKIAHGGFIWASVIPVIITSSVVSWYFFTNHGLKPIDDGNDILAATTTVTVPEVCNKLHSNFSYHAEHHLFPNMNPHYYPLVSNLFKKHFPSQYHCIPIWEAWRGILQNAIAATRRETPPKDATQRAAPDQATRQPEPV